MGKSSLIRRFCQGSFTSTYKKTIGMDFLEKVVTADNGRQVRLMLWDTGYESARQFCRAFRPESAAPATGATDNPFETGDADGDLALYRYHDYARTDQARERRRRYLAMLDDLLCLLRD